MVVLVGINNYNNITLADHAAEKYPIMMIIIILFYFTILLLLVHSILIVWGHCNVPYANMYPIQTCTRILYKHVPLRFL